MSPPVLKFVTRTSAHGNESGPWDTPGQIKGDTSLPMVDSYYGIGFLYDLRRVLAGQSQKPEFDWTDNHLNLNFKGDLAQDFKNSSQLTVIVSRNFRRASVFHLLQAESLASLSERHELQLVEIPFTINFHDGFRTQKIPVKVYQLKEDASSSFSAQLRYDLTQSYNLDEANPANNTALGTVTHTVLSYLSNRYGHPQVDTSLDQPDWSFEALINAFWRVHPDMSEQFVKFVPIVASPLLAQWVGAASVIITDQSEQYQKNFKPLGAHNFLKYHIERGVDTERTAVVAASHGNHAQGVVLAAHNLGFKETLLVLPLHEQTSKVKIRACLEKGALVMLHGSNLFHAMNRAKDIEAKGLVTVLSDETVQYLSAGASDEQINAAIKQGYTVLMYGNPADIQQNVNDVEVRFDRFSKKSLFVPTYDHPQISMGQGVDMMDLLARVPSLLQGAWHYVFPLGGMGKGTGDGTVLKHLNPAVKIEGISSDLVPAAKRSLQRRRWAVKRSEVTAPEGEYPKYADGTDVPDIGRVTFKQYAKIGGGVQTVTEDEIGEALVFAATNDWYHGEIKEIEGAPASVIAALLNGAVKVVPGERIVLSITGKNVDESTFSRAFQNHGWVIDYPHLYRVVTRFRTYLRATFGENAELLIKELNKNLKLESFLSQLAVQYEDHLETDLSELQNKFLETVPQYLYDSRFRDIMPHAVQVTIDFFARVRFELETKRKNGLDDYATDLGGVDYANSWQDEFKKWLVTNRAHARKDGNYSRLAYVFLRERELEKKGFYYKADVISGQIDEGGNPIKLHVELTRKAGVDPKGVIIIMTGYGESVVQYQQIVEQFVSEGFAVVACDYRGHGLSDSPKGIPGYMDSVTALLNDARAVIKWSKKVNQKDLRLFSFGFSQGALIQMALQNESSHKATFDALSVVSPTISLGRRYEDKPSDETSPLLEIAPLDASTGEWNVVRQNILFDSEPGQFFKKWLNRGFASPYYLRRPSMKVWKSLIAELSTFLTHRITEPLSAFIGTRDQIIGPPDILDTGLENIISSGNSHFTRKYFERRGHYLLLDREGQSEEIVNDSLKTFNGFLNEYQNWLNIGKELESRNLVNREVFEKRLHKYFRYKDLWCEMRIFVEGVLSGEIKPNSSYQFNALAYYVLGRLGVRGRTELFGKNDQVFEDEIAADDNTIAEGQGDFISTGAQPETVLAALGITTASGLVANPILNPLVPK